MAKTDSWKYAESKVRHDQQTLNIASVRRNLAFIGFLSE
jgi:hypothetical protein